MARRTSLLTLSRPVGSAYELIAAERFVEADILQTKTGKLFSVLELETQDPECQEVSTRDRKARVWEKALRCLPPSCRLRIYQIKEEAPAIVIRSSYPNEAAAWLHQAHHHAVEKRAGELHHIRTVVVVELNLHSEKQPTSFGVVRWWRSRFSQTALTKELEVQLTKDCQTLRSLITSFTELCGEDFPLRVLPPGEAYVLLQQLHNPAVDHRLEGGHVVADFLDVALSRSSVECHATHLKVGEWFVSTLALKMTPAMTEADLTEHLRAVRGRWTIAMECRRVDDIAARQLIELRQRQHWSNRSRYVLKTSLRDNPNEERLKNHTAYANVEDAGLALEALEREGHSLFECSFTIVAYARSEAELRQLVSEIIRALNRRDVVVLEETLNRPASYFAHFPGNHAWNVRYLHLFDSTIADLTPLFAPGRGDTWNPHLRDWPLTVLETRMGTPSGVNLHAGDVGHTLVLGVPGAGKSSATNHFLSQFQQYHPLVFGLDVGGSYKPLTQFCGGSYFELDPERQPFHLAPFALPLNANTRPQLGTWVKLLINRNATQIPTEDEQEIDQGIVSLYALDPALRTLSTLASILPARVAKHLRPWTGDGPYARFFDHNSACDNFTVRDFQFYDFRGLSEFPEVLGPFVYLLSCRIEQVIADPALRDRLKILVSDETWRLVGHDAIRDRLLREGLKTWRKYNGVVLLVTQSTSDLTSTNLFEVIADSCPTKIFLAQPELDEAIYARLFHLNPVELRLLRELRPKGELLLKQPHRSQVLTLHLDPKSYWLFTTNPYEAKRRDEVFAAHGIEQGLTLLTQETHS